MKPSIGRIVNFRPTNEVVWAALITDVRGENDIDLTVFPPSRPVMHRQHVTQGMKSGQWSWPEIVSAPAATPDTEEVAA